ncbi:hypothetical protein K438DRAFT_1965017 [Mycena galopus ATCC 62051]|nr:hypothetical protein K438DRAFT_1965017 [Mycena galopus ATCC 62051]
MHGSIPSPQRSRSATHHKHLEYSITPYVLAAVISPLCSMIVQSVFRLFPSCPHHPLPPQLRLLFLPILPTAQLRLRSSLHPPTSTQIPIPIPMPISGQVYTDSVRVDITRWRFGGMCA